MCILETCKQVIKDLVDSNETFTAYDVTEEVRSLVTDRVFHYKLRNVIHDEMSQYPNYIREQDFNINPNGPIVYKPRPEPSLKSIIEAEHTRNILDKIAISNKDYIKSYNSVYGILDQSRKDKIDSIKSNLQPWYGTKPSTGKQPGRKYYNVRKGGKFVKLDAVPVLQNDNGQNAKVTQKDKWFKRAMSKSDFVSNSRHSNWTDSAYYINKTKCRMYSFYKYCLGSCDLTQYDLDDINIWTPCEPI